MTSQSGLLTGKAVLAGGPGAVNSNRGKRPYSPNLDWMHLGQQNDVLVSDLVAFKKAGRFPVENDCAVI